MIFKFQILVVGILLCQNLLAQSIWPGDVNNNGLVNKIDLLYLGYAFEATGEARENVDGNWEAKNLPSNWAFSFPNGLNFSYADCNGDGIVNELDAQIIRQNVDLSHNDIIFEPDVIIPGIPGISPTCSFLNPPTSAPVNEEFILEIGLGDEQIPVENMSGLSFTINVEPDILGINNAEVSLVENSWLEPDSTSSIALDITNNLRAEYKIGFTKTNQIPVNGGGGIVKFSYLIEGDIIDLLVIDTITFSIDSITVDRKSVV